MGKNVSIEDQLLDAISPGRSIGRELAISAYQKISKLKSRVDELTKAKGELLQKLAKAESNYERLVARNREQERAQAAYSEGVGALLDKAKFEIVRVEPAEQSPPVEMQPSSFRSSLTEDTPKPSSRYPWSLAPTLIADSLVNENDMTLRKVYAFYIEDAAGNRETPRISLDVLGIQNNTFELLQNQRSTKDKLWFVAFDIPAKWDIERVRTHIESMERQAKAYTRFVNGRVPVPTVAPIEDSVQSKSVSLPPNLFAATFEAARALHNALGNQHPICKLIDEYTFRQA